MQTCLKNTIFSARHKPLSTSLAKIYKNDILSPQVESPNVS